MLYDLILLLTGVGIGIGFAIKRAFHETGGNFRIAGVNFSADGTSFISF